MAKSNKTWGEKYAEINAKGHIVKPVAKDMMGMKKGQLMLIPTPEMVSEVIKEIPKGEVKDTPYLRKILSERVGADVTCPITTGIFLRVAVEAAHEDYEAGCPMSELLPFWRVIGEKAPITKKVSFDLAPYFEQQDAERLNL
jgi:hypothetical protein